MPPDGELSEKTKVPLPWLWAAVGVMVGGAMAILPMLLTKAKADAALETTVSLIDERGKANVQRLNSHDAQLHAMELRLQKSELATDAVLRRLDKLETRMEENKNSIIDAMQRVRR